MNFSQRRSALREKSIRAAKKAIRVSVGLGSFVIDALHATTPSGKAEAAFERGDDIFQIALAIDDDTSRTLSAVKAIGWTLDDVDYYSEEVVTTTMDHDGATREVHTPERYGTYRFRRTTSS